ncbi:hypothetical protein [Bacillus sp. FJAT-42315]|uniref:hypothetical protein n=1 Tax=Bacillus sp. FJAT-42315 TaxID=2014077 RepID=UPI000C240BE9|nr:hypothetical protein [Bacillus sp. FJAT-42315]
MNTPGASVIVDQTVTVQGTTNIDDVAGATFTNNGTLGNINITDANGTRFINNSNNIGNVTINAENPTAPITLGGNIPNLTVSKKAQLEVADGAQIGTLKVDAADTTINNAGTIEEVQANANTEITGIVPDQVTPGNGVDVTVPKFASLTTENPALTSGVASTFTVKANKKIGSNGVENTDFVKKDWPTSAFTYTTDGAFYTLELTKADGTAVKFADVFSAFNLQLQGSPNVHDFIGGSSSQRSQADAGVEGITNSGTKFFNGSQSLKTLNDPRAGSILFYGLHSEIYGTNFNVGDTGQIGINQTIKPDAMAGDYKLTVKLYAPVRKDKDTQYTTSEFDSLTPIDSVTFTFTK